jgi:hypothetical protein
MSLLVDAPIPQLTVSSSPPNVAGSPILLAASGTHHAAATTAAISPSSFAPESATPPNVDHQRRLTPNGGSAPATPPSGVRPPLFVGMTARSTSNSSAAPTSAGASGGSGSGGGSGRSSPTSMLSSNLLPPTTLTPNSSITSVTTSLADRLFAPIPSTPSINIAQQQQQQHHPIVVDHFPPLPHHAPPLTPVLIMGTTPQSSPSSATASPVRLVPLDNWPPPPPLVVPSTTPSPSSMVVTFNGSRITPLAPPPSAAANSIARTPVVQSGIVSLPPASTGSVPSSAPTNLHHLGHVHAGGVVVKHSSSDPTGTGSGATDLNGVVLSLDDRRSSPVGNGNGRHDDDTNGVEPSSALLHASLSSSGHSKQSVSSATGHMNRISTTEEVSPHNHATVGSSNGVVVLQRQSTARSVAQNQPKPGNHSIMSSTHVLRSLITLI